MNDRSDKKSFWATLPGILTGLAAVIVAIGGILAFFYSPIPSVTVPVIKSFEASPSDIIAGGCSTLSWSVSGATSVTIDPGIGDVAHIGKRKVSPAESTTYILTATNKAGRSATAQVMVSAPTEQPDLVIIDVWDSGNKIHYIIKNQGNETAGSSTTKLYIDGVYKSSDSVDPLNPGKDRFRYFTDYLYSCSGSDDSIKVVVDATGKVSESNEGNNRLTVGWDCPKHKVTLTTIADEDGHVRSDRTVNPYPNVGYIPNGEAQAFLSFDISDIPEGSTILDVMVDFSEYDILGNPFGNLSCLRAYPHDYGTLDAGDYYIGSPLGALLRFCSSSELDTPVSDLHVASALQEKLGSSRFQLRLQFKDRVSDGDRTTDMVRFGTIRLMVTYSTP